MDKLAVRLALQGAIVLAVSLVSGFMTHRAIVRDGNVAAWHLAHAGGSARGVMLMALAAIVRLIVLPASQLLILFWLVVFFTWTSVAAMILAAASGQRGQRFEGSNLNRLVYALYFVGVVAVFPAGVVLIIGLFRAL